MKQTSINDTINYICKECCSMHKGKVHTNKCESWCKENNSCCIKSSCYSVREKEVMN